MQHSSYEIVSTSRKPASPFWKATHEQKLLNLLWSANRCYLHAPIKGRNFLLLLSSVSLHRVELANQVQWQCKIPGRVPLLDDPIRNQRNREHLPSLLALALTCGDACTLLNASDQIELHSIWDLLLCYENP